MATVGSLPAHPAAPNGEGPWPAMLLVHERFGLHEVVRRHEGFLEDHLTR